MKNKIISGLIVLSTLAVGILPTLPVNAVNYLLFQTPDHYTFTTGAVNIPAFTVNRTVIVTGLTIDVARTPDCTVNSVNVTLKVNGTTNKSEVFPITSSQVNLSPADTYLTLFFTTPSPQYTSGSNISFVVTWNTTGGLFYTKIYDPSPSVWAQIWASVSSSVAPSVVLNPVNLQSYADFGVAYATFNATLTSDGGEATRAKFWYYDATDNTSPVSVETGGKYFTGQTIGLSILEPWRYGHYYAYWVEVWNTAGSTNSTTLVATPTIVSGRPVAETLGHLSFIYTENTSATVRGFLVSNGNATTNTSFQYRTWNGTSGIAGAWAVTANTTQAMGSQKTAYLTSLNTSINYQFRFVAYNTHGNSTGAIYSLNWANLGSTAYITVGPSIDGKRVELNGLITNTGNLSGQYNFKYKLSAGSTWTQTPLVSFAANFTDNAIQYVNHNLTGLAPGNYDVEMWVYNVQYPQGVPPGGGVVNFIRPAYPTANISTWKAEEEGIALKLFGNVTYISASARVFFEYWPASSNVNLIGLPPGHNLPHGGTWAPGTTWTTSEITINPGETGTYYGLTYGIPRNTIIYYRFIAVLPDSSRYEGVILQKTTSMGAIDPNEPASPKTRLENSALAPIGWDTPEGKMLASVVMIILFMILGGFAAHQIDSRNKWLMAMFCGLAAACGLGLAVMWKWIPVWVIILMACAIAAIMFAVIRSHITGTTRGA